MAQRLVPDPPYVPREALKWAHAIRLQAMRVRAAQEELVSLPGGDFTRAQQEVFLRCDAEIHFLLIASRNLLRALEQLQPLEDVPDLVRPELKASIIRLRNCLEHWDQHEDAFKFPKGLKGQALRKHHEEMPFTPPTQHTWTAEDTILGGRVSVAQLSEVAQRAYDIVTQLEDAGTLSIVPPWRPEDGVLADLTDPHEGEGAS